MEGTRDIPNRKQKSLFLRDFRTKSDGDFAEMQIIISSCIFLKCTIRLIHNLKVIDDESLIVFFGQLVVYVVNKHNTI